MEQEVAIEGLDAFAAQFWNEAGEAKVFAFHGPMGAGKTTIITALCKYKGVTDTISSPTFSVINQYAYNENGEEKFIYHIDLYRLKSLEEVVQTGVEDCLYSNSICMVEWPERAEELLDENTMHIQITPVTTTQRMIKIEKAVI